MDDVNSGAVSPATSSVAQGPETVSQPTSQPPATSAETLNPGMQEQGRVPESIPYSRFQEVNNKYREAETRLKEFEDMQKNFSAYQRLDQLALSNPILAEKLKVAIYESLGKGQPPEQYGNEWQAQGGQDQSQFMAPLVRLMDNIYTEQFRNYAKQQGISEKAMGHYINAAKQYVLQVNPDPINNFSTSDIPKLFEIVNQNIQSVWNDLQSQYIQDKKNDVLPPSTSQVGSSPVAMPTQLKTQPDQSRYLAQELKRRGFGV